MSPGVKVAIGVVAALIVIQILPLPGLVTMLLSLGVIAAPIAGWFLLTPEQRRRIQRMRKRGQIGR